MVQTILSRVFYAKQEGKMPLVAGIISIGVNAAVLAAHEAHRAGRSGAGFRCVFHSGSADSCLCRQSNSIRGFWIKTGGGFVNGSIRFGDAVLCISALSFLGSKNG